MTLTTPAIASEPYCAEAPSRRISIRSIAAAGNAAQSTACEPWFTVPSGASCRFTSAERCRRMPFISTRVWSGDRLRRLTGRISAVPSAIGKRCVFNDGAMRVSDSVRSNDAWFCTVLPDRTSTGDSVSVGDKPRLRVPVVTISSIVSSPDAPCAIAVCSGRARTVAARTMTELARNLFFICIPPGQSK